MSLLYVGISGLPGLEIVKFGITMRPSHHPRMREHEVSNPLQTKLVFEDAAIVRLRSELCARRVELALKRAALCAFPFASLVNGCDDYGQSITRSGEWIARRPDYRDPDFVARVLFDVGSYCVEQRPLIQLVLNSRRDGAPFIEVDWS